MVEENLRSFKKTWPRHWSQQQFSNNFLFCRVEIVERRLIWTKQMAKKNRRSYPKSLPRVAGDGEGLKRGKKNFWMRIWTERRAGRAKRKNKKGNHPNIKINTLNCLRVERITVLLSVPAIL